MKHRSEVASNRIVAEVQDVIHHDNDVIDVHVFLSRAGSRSDYFALVRTDFWDKPRIHERYCCLIGGDLDDVDALAIAVFERLAWQLREYGTDSAMAIYPSHQSLLDEVPPAIAARLDGPLRKLVGIVAEEGQTTAVRLTAGAADSDDRRTA